MSFILWIVFAAAELALMVLTFTKQREKIKWLKNRVFFRIGELALLTLVLLLPGTNGKWRFYGCLILLVLRLAVSGIAYLIRRKKTTGVKAKAGAIVSAVLSVMLIGFSLVPAFVFTGYRGLETTGEYDVKRAKAILVDENRIDSFDGSFREVPAYFFYPDNADESFPLVVFSHGAFGYYESNYSTYVELASNGYVVVSLDHPHHALFTKNTGGNPVIVDDKFITDAVNVGNGDVSREEEFALVHEWLSLRTEDESFVLDTVKTAKDSARLSDAWHTENEDNILEALSETDTDKIGLMGHSLGGASSVQLGRERSDIDAVVDLDGTMYGDITGLSNGEYELNDEPYPVPVLDFLNESNYNEVEQLKRESGFVYVNDNLIRNAKDGKTVVFKGTEHMDFTDLPLISPFFASMLGKGEVNSEEFLPLMNGIVLNWFDYYLKGEGTLDIQAQY